jgi:uncharacterized protein
LYVNPETEQAVGRYIDAFEFVRLGKALEGVAPLAWFERVIEDMPEQDPEAMVRWSATADRGPADEPLIRLDVHAVVTVQCERCLGSMAIALDSEIALQLVQTEAELDDPDSFDFAELEDIEAGVSFDKVLGTGKFDLLEQVEDELVLCVPFVPKHDVCPAQPGGEVPEQGEAGDELEKRPSPFAVLASLKSRKDTSQ